MPRTDKWGWAIIAVAIVWAAVIIASAMILEGTPYGGRLVPILGGGAAATIVILGGVRTRRENS